jgi:ethanolamine ammonia-lyase large subunit
MVGTASAVLAGYKLAAKAATGGGTILVTDVKPGEDVFAYVGRIKGGFDQTLYQQVIGAANDFKEGDQAIGVAAADEVTRSNARALLANTRISDLHAHPMLVDDLQRLIWQTTDQAQHVKVQNWTMGQLKEFLLTAPEPEIKGVMYGLSSDTIGCVPKLMTNQELIALGQNVFNVLPGTRIGAKGYMGARIQPNSPTDHPDDVVWQVFDAFAYATGDIVIGTNPVDSTVASVTAVENALKDVIDTFGLRDTIP